MEARKSFFKTLRAELLDLVEINDAEKATEIAGDDIEKFYKLVRRHSLDGYLSPVEFELRCRNKNQSA